jgi:polar amino acid transport system substrate-binding protein
MKRLIPSHRRKRPGHRVPKLVAASAVMVLAFAGCAALGTPGSATSGSAGLAANVPALVVDEAAAQLLPDSIKSAKVLKVAIPTNEPPTQYYRDGTQDMTGVNPDVARLMGQALGVGVEIHVANFDSIIPGMAADRYDMTVSSMTPTTQRMQVLDFVDYMQVGNVLAVAKGNPLGLDEHSLCGRKVGFLIASYQLSTLVPEYDADCTAAGKDQIQTSEFQDSRQAISALTSGRLDAVLADSPILDFAVTQSPDIEIASRYDFTPVGIGVPKDSKLVESVSVALSDVLRSASYVQVLENYGLESSAITDARVNFAQ